LIAYTYKDTDTTKSYKSNNLLSYKGVVNIKAKLNERDGLYNLQRRNSAHN
jgi:hypothetical protein